ncbi:MAG: sugar transferase [Chloroflexi bacterium]|nr:sugar transferase [Chloroflexota bacterium]
MVRRFSVDFALLLIFLDGLIVVLSLRLAVYIRPFLNSLSFIAEVQNPYSIPGPLYIIFTLMWVLVMMLFSVYDIRRFLLLRDEITRFTLASAIAGVSLAGFLYISYRDVSRFFYLYFIVQTYLFQLCLRLAFRSLIHFRGAAGIKDRGVLIVGAGEVGLRLKEQIEQYGDFGLKLIGFLDDNPQKQASNGLILGGLEQARDVIQNHLIDDVVLALPQRAYQTTNELVTELHDLPVKVWVVPDYFSLALNRASMEELAGIPMIDLRAPAINDYDRMIKRFFDIVISLVSLPFAIPIGGLIALAIKLDSPGPVVFRQERVGENGRIFDMYKFRSMVVDAERLNNPVERVDENGKIMQDKRIKDPRVTRVGRFIRRTSLDELPQLINVFRGEMSLVGPRPELPYLVDKYEQWQRRRFAIPQGITGWWQINGRSDKPMHLHTDEDLYYLQNYSIWLDLRILFKTAWVVLMRKGAY